MLFISVTSFVSTFLDSLPFLIIYLLEVTAEAVRKLIDSVSFTWEQSVIFFYTVLFFRICNMHLAVYLPEKKHAFGGISMHNFARFLYVICFLFCNVQKAENACYFFRSTNLLLACKLNKIDAVGNHIFQVFLSLLLSFSPCPFEIRTKMFLLALCSV